MHGRVFGRDVAFDSLKQLDDREDSGCLGRVGAKIRRPAAWIRQYVDRLSGHFGSNTSTMEPASLMAIFVADDGTDLTIPEK